MPEQTPLSIHEPVGQAKGGIIVIQEAFGVNDHIEDVSGRFAEDGWLAVAPHLFHRSGDPKFGYDDVSHVMPHMRRLGSDDVLADISATLAYLTERRIGPQRIGVVGFCMGGTIALITAVRFDVGAAVSFYGGGVAEGRFGFGPLIEEAARLRAPWLGLYGDKDNGIAVADVERLRTAAASSGEVTEVVRYADAGHGFHCDQRSDYHPTSAQDAWQRTLEWFNRHLST